MTEAKYFYPNRMGRILLQSTEDVSGRGGLLALLRTANMPQYINSFPGDNLDKKFSFENVSSLMESIDRFYGPHNGRNVALRIGQKTFKRSLYEFGPVTGIADLTVRLLPWSVKLMQWATAFSDLYNRLSDQLVVVEDAEEHLNWHVDRCPFCWGRHVNEPRCFVMRGMLEESLLWLSGGKVYAIEQTASVAAGDSRCTFTINKKPLG